MTWEGYTQQSDQKQMLIPKLSFHDKYTLFTPPPSLTQTYTMPLTNVIAIYGHLYKSVKFFTGTEMMRLFYILSY